MSGSGCSSRPAIAATTPSSISSETMARRDSEAWLVVGGDGLIGRALTARLAGEGRAVLATTRRRGCAGAGRPRLELSENPMDWTPPSPVSVAFLVAAAAN